MEPFLIDPRISGMKEHLRRIKRFTRNAKRAKKQESKFRNHMAAVYSARAIADLMFECADKKLIKLSREDLKKRFVKEIPFFELIGNIRIHDFHRFGCLPPSNEYKTLFVNGPIELTAKSGYAGMQISPKGIERITTGNSRINEQVRNEHRIQRPLYKNDGLFYYESSSRYIKLEDILEEYTLSIEKVVREFEQLIG
jgi:hypothetical protein